MADTPSAEPGITSGTTSQHPIEKEPAQEYIEQPVVDYHGDPPRPSGWMYKSFKVGGLRIPWYASPRIQLGMVAFVCFMCPGMFNALSGLGGGGKADPHLADVMVLVSYPFGSLFR